MQWQQYFSLLSPSASVPKSSAFLIGILQAKQCGSTELSVEISGLALLSSIRFNIKISDQNILKIEN